MSRPNLFESLESRTLFSAATLSQDEAALAAAVAQRLADRAASITALAADRAQVKADGKSGDPALVGLRNTLKQDQLARDNTIIADHTALKTATNNDRIAILIDRANIRADRADNNMTQLATDKATLSADLLKLANDRDTLGTTLNNDVISTKATVIADRQAIVNEILHNTSDTQLAMDKQKLVNDSLMWTDTLANDRKTILSDELIVAQDKHGG